MRKVLISAAAAISALAFAAPAAAQYYPAPAPQPYGYNNGYNGYGYNNNYGQVRALQVRVDRIQQQINRLDQRNVLSEREASRLRAESRGVEQRLRYSARYGLNPREFANVNAQIQRLERHVWQEASDRNGRRGGNWNNGNGYNGQYGYADRDRDGRNDRYEDDQGYRHD